MLHKVDMEVEEILNNEKWFEGTYLKERSSNIHKNILSGDSSDFSLDDWLSRFEKNKKLFLERLELEDITYEQFKGIISANEGLRTHQDLKWFKYLKRIFVNTKNTVLQEEDVNFLYENKIPFSKFLYPFLKIAKVSIDKYEQEFKTYITSNNLKKFIYVSIANNLIKLSGKTLIYELNKQRIDNKLIGNTPEERYEYFLNNMYGNEEKVLKFLIQYPVLARLICETTEDIIANVILAMKRFIKDIDQIKNIYNLTSIKIKSIEMLGDSHRGGNTVLKFSFSEDEKIIYKPRSLSIDVHFQELLNWFNTHGIEQKFKVLHVIDKGEYGWQEYISYKQCQDKEEIKKFYERQGQYLAILYMLNATDFHYENLIAHGEYPMLVDIESIFHNFVNEIRDYKTSATSKAINIISDSVIRTSLLPVFADDLLFDIEVSGLGGGMSQEVQRNQVINLNTDVMRIVKSKVMTPSGNNLPKFNGKVFKPERYINSIKAGFLKTYHVIMKHANTLTSKESILYSFQDDVIRVILRNTAVYGALLEASTHPKYLKDGLERQRLFEFMWSLANNLPERKATIICEVRDLLRNDIPYFYSNVNSLFIYGGSGEKIKGLLQKDSLSLVFQKLNNFSEEDCNRQLEFIEKSLLTYYFLGKQTKKVEASIVLNKEDSLNQRQAFLEEAIRIGKVLAKEAIWGEDQKSVTWIGMGMNADEKLQYKVMDMGLYNGVMGMAMFFAYLGKESKIEEFTKISRACIETALQERLLTRAEYISGYLGYVSCIYVLMHLSRLWNDDSLLQKAEELLNDVEAHISQDGNFDLLSGCAGTILVCLDLYNLNGNAQAIRIARKCGEHLIKHKKQMEKGCGWLLLTKKDEHALAGLSHGVTGIALALLKLYGTTKQKKYLYTALEGLEYENSLYSKEKNNWADLRLYKQTGKYEWAHHWCNGAPGIGIGRLKMLDYYQDEAIYKDLDRAIQSTLKAGFNEWNYSLCHGDMGNLEFLLLVSTHLNRYKYLSSKVYGHAGYILDKVKKAQFDWKCGIPGGQQTPNFMVGLSGIGYQLLRFYNPILPSVLILE
ncbi:type 2 lantibiotic biosynthesis protein LanM [Bacillus cereus VD107]|nr:type 2 lantibiotic biosynthesis protein LanM [Bacillus cereus VD107]